MNLSKLSYRAEIDGLRAIAIVSVILYHAQMVLFGRDWFEGGFIGVDIFFVISGYLITRIILSELQTKDSFRFLNFYERRARRILPMLLFVIFVSIPFAWQKLLPSDFVEYAESILASIYFISNFFFYFSTTEYGANSALLKPFLHTWSLGVEEQFYLVFPLIAFVAFKYFRSHFLTILVGLSLVSLQFAELMEVSNSDLNFYLPFSRFWELAVGSFLAYRELNYKAVEDGIGKRVFPVLGLYLVVYSTLFFDSKTPHPGFYTLIPVIGVALIIGFASKDELVGRILGSKPFVWLGLISYSAYLWHFPIFAFSRMEEEPGNTDKVLLIALSLVLSILSYQFIEKPFRNRAVGRKSFFSILAICAVFTTIFALYVITAFSHKNIEENARFHAKSLLDRGAFLEVSRDQAIAEQTLTNFEDNSKKKVLIIGNSHGIDFFRVLQSSAIYKDIDFGLVTQNRNTGNYQVSCFYQYIIKQDIKCGKKNVEFYDLEEKLDKSETVILKTRWQKTDIEVLEKLISALIDSDKKVVVVGNAFEQRGKILLRDFVSAEGRIPTGSELKELGRRVFETAQHIKVDDIDSRLKKLSHKMNVPFLSAKDLFCDYEAKECEIFTPKGYLILWDYGHMTLEGGKYVGEIISRTGWGQNYIK